jgi:hypothetical protein
MTVELPERLRRPGSSNQPGLAGQNLTRAGVFRIRTDTILREDIV